MNRADLLPAARVRELMAGCYPQPRREDKRVTASRRKAERAAAMVAQLKSAPAAARRLRMREKSLRNLLCNHGYSVSRLTGKE